jgi:murein DD-endopeptidase MepM/ murein hydrolase activator NlpD
VFPVGGKPFSYARTHHDYPATDIIANCGLPVRAATGGVILEVSRKDLYNKSTDDPAERGGISISLLGDDGVRYYGSHLSAISAGIDAGVRVRAGQQIGKVGTTGNSSACHLHFGISPPCARTGDWWVRRGVLWPYTYLDAWRAGKNRSPKAAVAAWKADHGCPRSAP